MDKRTIVLISAAVPVTLLAGALLRGDGGTAPQVGSEITPESIVAFRKTLPDIPGKVVREKKGIMYVGRDDTSHLAWLRERLTELAEAESNQARRRGIQAFNDLLKREGSTTALNTYDNQILTWGVGFGGKAGLLPSVLSRLAGTRAAATLAAGGFSFIGKNQYEIADADGKPVRGNANALELVRTVDALPKLLVFVARDPVTREDVLRAQLETFLQFGGKVEAQEEAATQALFNLIAHLKHWAPGFGNGSLAWAAKQVPGPPSRARDVNLAEKALEYFYSKAKKIGGWIPSWPQAKGYWKHMVEDGLSEAAGHPILSMPEPPGSAGAIVGAWGDARGDSVYKLISALSDGHSKMQSAMIRLARTADGLSPTPVSGVRETPGPNMEALSGLLSWARSKFGPDPEAKEIAINTLVFIGQPWFGLDMPQWAEFYQNLQNFIDEYAGSTAAQYTEVTFNKAEWFRKQFNDFAAKMRAKAATPDGKPVPELAIPDIQAVALAPVGIPTVDLPDILPEASDVKSAGVGLLAGAAGLGVIYGIYRMSRRPARG